MTPIQTASDQRRRASIGDKSPGPRCTPAAALLARHVDVVVDDAARTAGLDCGDDILRRRDTAYDLERPLLAVLHDIGAAGRCGPRELFVTETPLDRFVRDDVEAPDAR